MWKLYDYIHSVIILIKKLYISYLILPSRWGSSLLSKTLTRCPVSSKAPFEGRYISEGIVQWWPIVKIRLCKLKMIYTQMLYKNIHRKDYQFYHWFAYVQLTCELKWDDDEKEEFISMTRFLGYLLSRLSLLFLFW